MKELIIEVPDNFGKTLKPEKVNVEIKEEIVRCKDCLFGMWTKNFLGEDRIACVKEESFVQEDRALPPEWFCADGERREAE